MISEGWRIILWTMRSGKELAEAEQWFKDRGIELWAVNDNPEQGKWTTSRKVYAHLYIDDAAACAPLLPELPPCGRPMVDWKAVELWVSYLK